MTCDSNRNLNSLNPSSSYFVRNLSVNSLQTKSLIMYTFYLRHVIVRPDHVTWETVNYDDPTVSLVRTDYDRMTSVPEPVSVSDGQYRALKMKFNLPSSSYATMLVREILKTDTSPSYHSALNKH